MDNPQSVGDILAYKFALGIEQVELRACQGLPGFTVDFPDPQPAQRRVGDFQPGGFPPEQVYFVDAFVQHIAV